MADAIRTLKDAAKSQDWGVRIELHGNRQRLTALSAAADQPIPTLLIDPVFEDLSATAAEAHSYAEQVLAEACSIDHADALLAAGFDSVVLKGHEAGGRVSQQSSYMLLQQARTRLAGKKYYLQGGIGIETAAASAFAGATGVIWSEQLWLTSDSPATPTEREVYSRLDGSETTLIGDPQDGFRFFSQAGRDALKDWARKAAVDSDWVGALQDHLATADPSALQPHGQALFALGQEIAFAGKLAERFGSVGRVLHATRLAVQENVHKAAEQKAVAPRGPLAAEWGTEFPIAQGPMTRVSDVAPFAKAVAENGGLPFLALSLMRGPAIEKLLEESKASLGDLPWGVGVLGFVPAQLREEQMKVVEKFAPPYAIVAGGRPSQVKELEAKGTTAYLHVPSPGLLKNFVKDGARKFIFEGRECGGHVGPRPSFILWQSAIDLLRSAEIDNPEDVHLLFAGGVHDDWAAAIVSVLAAPLVDRGMRVGVLMGTGYLFTHEAVESGAITEEFQRQAIECRSTALLDSGGGHATRCAPTPFVDEFQQRKRELTLEKEDPAEVRFELEVLNVGRLRLASKGVEREGNLADPDNRSPLVEKDIDEQRARGMYMIGDVAMLREEAVPMRRLHESVTVATQEVLADATREPSITVKNEPGEPLAIVGMGCQLPESPTLRAYWENIVRGFDAIKETPGSRWNWETFYSANRLERDRIYSKWGSFLDDVRFDPVKYKIPPATLASIEPIQLLALEVAEQALIDANYHFEGFPREKTSVIFAAAGTHDLGVGYVFRTMMRHYLPQTPGLTDSDRERIEAALSDELLPEWTEDSFAGFLLNVVAGRIANRFDLRGPNYTVDAACASSFAALMTSVEQLRSGKVDAALVGAVDGTNNPFCYMSFAKTHALSPQGRSRPYDKDADGIGLGEGIAAIVLKRLSDAERDGDRVHAILRGIGASSDGRNRSLTAPFPAGQVTALRRAYADAGFDPGSVTLVEAHSTGTAVGDRVELTALNEVCRSERGRGIAIGSVKSNLGHTKTTAGLASLIKASLALSQRVLPPTIGVKEPNEQITREDSPFYVNTHNRPWLAPTNATRRAGVSAFGFGGTNFHVVMEEPGGLQPNLFPRDGELFTFSSATPADLVTALRKFADEVEAIPTPSLDQLGYSHLLSKPLAGGKARAAVVAESVADLIAKTRKLADEVSKLKGGDDSNRFTLPGARAAIDPSDDPQVAFLFPGQGSQAIGMLRELMLAYPDLYKNLEQADAQLAEVLPRPLSNYIFPQSAFTPAHAKELKTELDDTRVAQPALGVTDLFASRLLRNFGVTPKLSGGHSYGEWVALADAGVLPTDQLPKLSAERGRAVAEASAELPGGMIAVKAGQDRVSEVLEGWAGEASIANLNAPQQTIVAGPVAELDKLVSHLEEKGLTAKRLPVTAAFHSSGVAGAVEPLSKLLGSVTFDSATAKVFANATAGPYPGEPDAARELLTQHLISPVRFTDQLAAMQEAGAELFIEVGPGKVLSRLVDANLGKQADSVALDGGPSHAWRQFGEVLIAAYAAGCDIDASAWYASRGLEPIKLKAYASRRTVETAEKPTDWLVGPGGAKPANGKPKNKKPPVTAKPTTPKPSFESASNAKSIASRSVAAKPSRPGSNGVKTPPRFTTKTPAPAGPAHDPAPTQLNSPLPVSSQSPQTPLTPSTPLPPPTSSVPTMKANQQLSNHALHNATTEGAAAGVLQQVQATMNKWLDLQQGQMRANERFMEIQQQVVFASLGQAPLPPSVEQPLLPPPTVVDAPAQAASPAVTAAQQPTAPVVPPAPVLTPISAVASGPSPAELLRTSINPKPTVAAAVTNGHTAANGNGSDGNGHAGKNRLAEPASSYGQAATNGSAKPAPADKPAASGDYPSTEEFRTDLLNAVSERTGYPIEMLDEDAALEAELGIDSIKTVEIFSSLTQFHEFLPGGDDEDQEETLKAFSQMKSLRQIIEMFEQRRDASMGGDSTAAKADATPAQADGAEAESTPAVERYEVVSEEVGAPTAEKKKNSPMMSGS